MEWLGLTDKVDQTWEPLKNVLEGLPGLLENFLHTAGDRKLEAEARRLCSFD